VFSEIATVAHWRLLLLIAVLAGLLFWVWVTDRPSPAEPDGGFGPLVFQALALVAVAAVVAAIWRGWRGSSAGPPNDKYQA
jgi:ABC-type phosphate transport system permease subunit